MAGGSLSPASFSPAIRTEVLTPSSGYTRPPSFTVSPTPPQQKVNINYPGGGGSKPTTFGGYSPGSGIPSIPTGSYGFTGDPVAAPSDLSLPVPDWMCQVLTVLGVGCSWSDAISAGVAYLSGGSDSNNSVGAGSICPPGYEVDPETGICNLSGAAGTVQRVLPGGKTGTLGYDYGNAVVGAFGIPALQPAQVGTIRRRDGTTGPVLRCPKGAVLGDDDLCYMKGTIPRQFRKWKPAAKCPMTAADAKALRRIGTLQNRVKRLAKTAGLTTKKR